MITSSYNVLASEVLASAVNKITRFSDYSNLINYGDMIKILNDNYRYLFQQIARAQDNPFTRIDKIENDLGYKSAMPFQIRVNMICSAESVLNIFDETVYGGRLEYKLAGIRDYGTTGYYWFRNGFLYVNRYGTGDSTKIEYLDLPKLITFPGPAIDINIPFDCVPLEIGEEDGEAYIIYYGSDSRYYRYGVSSMSLKPILVYAPLTPLYRNKTVEVIKDNGYVSSILYDDFEIIDIYEAAGLRMVEFSTSDPLIWVTYEDNDSGRRESYVTNNIILPVLQKYNIEDYEHGSTYGTIYCGYYNNKNGLGVVYKRDGGSYSVQGYAPDTELRYPTQISYNLFIDLVARDISNRVKQQDQTLVESMEKSNEMFFKSLSKDGAGLRKLKVNRHPKNSYRRNMIWGY